MAHHNVLRTAGVLGIVLCICIEPAAQSARRGNESDRSTNKITLAEALKVLDVGEKTARMFNICVGLAVVDARADVIAAARMTCGGSVPGGIGKAVTAALFGRRSAALGQFATSPITEDLNEATGRRMNFLQGGVPIYRNGELIGAVGVSGGGSSQYDEEIGVAGINATF